MIWRPKSAAAYKRNKSPAQIFFLMDSNYSKFSPRCAYFFGFKRFSKNRQKVNIMANTEATVASSVKNWHVNLFSHSNWSYGMPIGAKAMLIFAKLAIFAFKVFDFKGPPIFFFPRFFLAGGRAGAQTYAVPGARVQNKERSGRS